MFNSQASAKRAAVRDRLRFNAQKKRIEENFKRVRENYADPDRVGSIIDRAIGDTTMGQMFIGVAGRNVPESTRYVLTTSGEWIDLTHIVSAAFNPTSFVGLGELPGVGVEIGQTLLLSDSGFRAEDFRSNTIGASATRAIEFSGITSSVGQRVQSVLTGRLMTQSEAHEYIHRN